MNVVPETFVDGFGKISFCLIRIELVSHSGAQPEVGVLEYSPDGTPAGSTGWRWVTTSSLFGHLRPPSNCPGKPQHSLRANYDELCTAAHGKVWEHRK
jgi:hypothetical protein